MGFVYALLIFAAIGVFLCLVIILRNHLSEPKRRAAWASISRMIQGEEHWGKIKGSYQGLPVETFIDGFAGEDIEYYCFKLRMNVPIRGYGYDWTLSYDGENSRWRIKTIMEPLERRLIEAGAVEAIGYWPERSEVIYRADRATLEYSITADGQFSTPTPEQFGGQLDLMKHLAEINEEVNVFLTERGE